MPRLGEEAISKSISAYVSALPSEQLKLLTQGITQDVVRRAAAPPRHRPPPPPFCRAFPPAPAPALSRAP